MASKLARRFRGTTHRRPSPLIAKLKDKLRSASRRAREGGGGKSLMRDVVAGASAAGLGKLEQMGNIPPRIGGIDTALIVGGLGAFVAPRFVKGKVGSLVHDAALGALCVGAYRLGSGQPLMGEDGLEGGGWGEA